MVSDTRQMDVYKIEKRNAPLSFGLYKEFLTFYYKTPIELQEGSLVTVHCTIPLTYLEESKEYKLSSSLPIHSVNASNNSVTVLINKYYTLNNISSIKTDNGVYLLSSNKHYFGEDSEDITIYVNDEDETGNITINPQKCSFVNENTLKWEDKVYEKEGNIVTYMRLNPIGDERYTNTVFYYEYKTQIPVALSGMSDVRLMQEDALNVDYVNRERAKLINPIVEMEKDIYHPVVKNGNSVEDVQRIVINPHFRQHRGEDWLAAPDSLWNGVTTEDMSFEDSFFSYKTKENQADLLTYLNFTDSDVKYQKSKIKKSFLRLMYFDSPDPTNQNMIGYSTIFMDAGRFFTKTIKNMESMPYQYTNVDGELMQDLVGIKVNREPYGDLTKNESEIEQYRLSSQFTVEDRYNSEGSSEGFYVYLWKDIDNYAPSDLYLKIEFNHAGYGRTIPLMMPYWLENEKDPNSDSEHGKKSIKTFNEILEDWRYGGYSLRKYNEYSYIHLKYQYDKKQKQHIYYLDPDVYGNINLSENGDLILNLYEAKISMGQVADNDVVYVTGYGDITNVKLNYKDIPSAGGLINPDLEYEQEVRYSDGTIRTIKNGAITTYTPQKINNNPFVSSLPSSGSDGALCIIEKKGKTTNTYTQYVYSNNVWRQINTYTFHTSRGWIQAGKNNQSKDIPIFTVSVTLKLNGKSETAYSNDITQLAGSSTELGETFTMQITNVPSEIGVNGQAITPKVTIYRSVTLSNGSTMTEVYTGGKFTYTWVLDNTVKGTDLTYTIPANTQFSPRSGSFTTVWEEGDNSLEETVNFIQEAAIPDADYTFESAMPKTNVFGSEGGTWTFYFNSYKDVNAQGYTITKDNNLTWFDVKNGKSGSVYNSSVVITVNKSETGNGDATVILKQNESNKEIILTISQEAGTVTYEFSYDDGMSSKTLNASSAEGTLSFNVISNKNSTKEVAFTMADADGLSELVITPVMDDETFLGVYGCTIKVSANKSDENRELSTKLIQDETGAELTLKVKQTKANSYILKFADSDDAELTVNVPTKGDSYRYLIISTTEAGVPIGLNMNSDDIPDWCDISLGMGSIAVGNSFVLNAEIAQNDGESRTFTLVLTQEGSGNTLKITFIQEAITYDFLFDDYEGTDVTYPHQQPVTEKSFKFDITSKNNIGEGVTFTASSDESWCTTEIKDNGKGSYTVTATYKDNDQKKERDCTITLTQEGSGNVLTMSFTQAGLQYDFWYDDYQDQDTIDVEFMSQPETKSFFMTSITNTGAQIGVLISGTTDWCSAKTEVDNNTGRLILYVTVTENTGSDRETQLVFTQEISNKKLYMNVSQKLVTYTFEFLEVPDKNEMTVTLDTLANTYQYNIVSLRHTVVETSVNFTITQNEGDEWCQVEHEVDEDDGIFLTTVSVSDNLTGSVRTSEIIFTQEDSGKTLKLIVNQDPKDYVFEFQDYSNTDAITLDTFDASQSTARVIINSLSPANEPVMPQHKSSDDWISYAVIEGTNGRFNVNINIPTNDSKESRDATITLTQPGSDRVLTIGISQEGEAEYEFYWVMGQNQITSVNTISGGEVTPDKTFYRSLQLVSTKNGLPFEDSVIEGSYYGSITKSIFSVSYPVTDSEYTTVEVGMSIQVLNDTKSGTWEIHQKESGLMLRFQYVVIAGANYQFQFSNTMGTGLQNITKYKEARYMNIYVSDSNQNITVPLYSTKDMNVWPTDTNRLLQTLPATAFVDQNYAGDYVFNEIIKVDVNYGEARSIDVHFLQRVYIDNINYEGSSIDLLLRIDQGASTNANTFMIPNTASTYSLRAMYPIVYAPANGGMISTEVVSYVNRKMTGFQIPSASGFVNNIIKTNKEYVHEVYFDIEPNPSTEERSQLVKFIQKDTNDEIIVEIIQEGKVEAIDYAVLKFSWDNTNGAKLDIASEISNSSIIIDGNSIDNTPVGYGFGPAYANERDIDTILPVYIEFGGVNTANNNQMEVLIHVKEIMDKNADLTSLIVNTYGNWVDTNNSVITIETNGYYGGSMQLVNNSFENVDGKLISSNTTQAYVYAQGSCNDPQINEDFRNNYTHFIETVYGIENNEINTIPTNYNEGNICS